MSGVDWDLVLTSLSFTKQAFESYPYPPPTEELRRERLRAVNEAMSAIRDLKRQQTKGG